MLETSWSSAAERFSQNNNNNNNNKKVIKTNFDLLTFTMKKVKRLNANHNDNDDEPIVFTTCTRPVVRLMISLYACRRTR